MQSCLQGQSRGRQPKGDGAKFSQFGSISQIESINRCLLPSRSRGSWVFGRSGMKNFLWVMRTTLRAALWRSTAAERSVSVSTVLVFVDDGHGVGSRAPIFVVDGPAVFSLYGVNSIIAAMAVFVAMLAVHFERSRDCAAQLARLAVLLEWTVIAAGRFWLTSTIRCQEFGLNSDKVVLACCRLGLVGWCSCRHLPGRRHRAISKSGLRAFWLSVVAGQRSLPCRHFRPSLAAISIVVQQYLGVGPCKIVQASEQTIGSNRRSGCRTLAATSCRSRNQEAFARAQGHDRHLCHWHCRLVRPGCVYQGIERWFVDPDSARHRSRFDAACEPSRYPCDHPVATRTNFAAAVHAVAGIMNKDEDVLVVFITSHGGPTGVGLVLGDAISVVLEPDHVASVLDREGIRNRVVIVSACYSGILIKPLASPNSIVLTAADENSPSFGCSNEREWTYFGDAFFNQSLGEGVSLEGRLKREGEDFPMGDPRRPSSVVAAGTFWRLDFREARREAQARQQGAGAFRRTIAKLLQALRLYLRQPPGAPCVFT